MGKGKAIGIDLGTTHSCVAVWHPDRTDSIEIIVNNQGNRTTPSMVAFTPSEKLLGDAAKDQLSTNPQNTVFDAKRLIGRRFNDPSVQSDMKHWPFTVVAGDKGQPLVQVEYKGEKKLYAAEMISSMVLVEMKRIADSYLDCDVKNAVITVPSYFNNSQRRATEDAAKDAGLNVMRIITGPTAAAIAYTLGVKKIYSSVTILVFVLGGRSIDVSVVDIQGRNFKVKASGGGMHLGGEDFDNRLLKHCIKRFNSINNKKLNISAKAVRRLRSECEKAKRDLSSALDTVIDIDCLYEGLNFHLNITRTEFEELNADLFIKCMQIVKGCVKGAKVSKGQIDKVVLVGGSTRIPKVKELLQGMFPGEKHCKIIRPEETVAYGAAVYAGTLKNKQKHIEIEDVTPLSKGDDTLLPSAPKKMSTTTAIDNESVRVSVEDDARKKMNATTAIDNVSAMESLTIVTPKKLNTRKKMNITTAVNSESVLENAVVVPTDTKAVENHSVVDSAVYEEEPRNKINRIKESGESRTAYQVFINHRGPDVKKNLASPIYHLLKCCGMAVFLDKNEIHTGDTLSYAISFAIQIASIHITIFSPRYAESSWCLDELSSILTSRRERGTKIIPVFYDVKPHDLRHIETGRYALTFQEHQQKRRVTIDVIQKWRSALNEVSHISGLEFEPEKDDTGELLERIKGVCSREIDGKL